MHPSYNNYELLCGTTQAGDAEPNEPGTHFDTSNNSMCGFSPPPTDPHAPQGPLEAGNWTDMPNSDLSQNLAPQWWSLLYADLTEDMILVLGKLSQAEWRHYGISFPEMRTRGDHMHHLKVNRNGS